MRAFSLSKFQPTHWLAMVVTAVLTWPMALGLALVGEPGREEAAAGSHAGLADLPGDRSDADPSLPPCYLPGCFDHWYYWWW